LRGALSGAALFGGDGPRCRDAAARGERAAEQHGERPQTCGPASVRGHADASGHVRLSRYALADGCAVGVPSLPAAFMARFGENPRSVAQILPAKPWPSQ
jgi:hypothetical protein